MNTRSLSGSVNDANNLLPLWLAHVVELDASGGILSGAVTNAAGEWTLPEYAGGLVRVSFVGYEPQTFRPYSSNVTVSLVPGVNLGEFEVVYTPDGSGAVIPTGDVPPETAPPMVETVPAQMGPLVGVAALLLLLGVVSLDN